MGWLKWSGLDADPDERTAFRRAGIGAADLLRLSAAEVAGATGGIVTEARADELVRRASLLEIATPAKVADLERAGVRDRADLAARDPDDLFRAWQDTSPYTGPVAHDGLTALVHAARGETGERSTAAWWTAQRERTGFDPMRIAWRHRYGDGPEPWVTRRRLRIPSLRVNAQVAEAGLDARGLPFAPFRHAHVTVAFSTKPTTAVSYVGHWMWCGRRGAFFRLEEVREGTLVELADGRSITAYEITSVTRGVAPLDVVAPPGGILLVTPPHLRWAPRLKTWDLPDDSDPERTWVQVGATALPA